MTDKINPICPYCKNEIRPLDHHVIRITPNDKISGLNFIEVCCQLNRYYHVEPVDQK
jgi:hypothetical protein